MPVVCGIVCPPSARATLRWSPVSADSKTEPSRNRPGRKKGTHKTGGRAKGTPNKVTVEAREACSLIVDDPIYRAKLLAKARKGALHPAVECMLWHYSKGKPVERHEHMVNVSLAEQLRKARERIAATIAAPAVPGE